MNGCSFQQVLRQNQLVFVITLEKDLSQSFHFKANRKNIGSSLKTATRNFQNSPPFERPVCFYVTISENFEHFKYFETDFLEKKNAFQNSGSTVFIDERTKIENASFPNKTAISKASVKTNRTVTAKWPYNKERSLASHYFIFLKKFFQFKNLS